MGRPLDNRSFDRTPIISPAAAAGLKALFELEPAPGQNPGRIGLGPKRAAFLPPKTLKQRFRAAMETLTRRSRKIAGVIEDLREPIALGLCVSVTSFVRGPAEGFGEGLLAAGASLFMWDCFLEDRRRGPHISVTLPALLEVGLAVPLRNRPPKRRHKTPLSDLNPLVYCVIGAALCLPPVGRLITASMDGLKPHLPPRAALTCAATNFWAGPLSSPPASSSGQNADTAAALQKDPCAAFPSMRAPSRESERPGRAEMPLYRPEQFGRNYQNKLVPLP